MEFPCPGRPKATRFAPMPLTRFDHVNVRTDNLDRMVTWYGEILGLRPGKRPDFGFPGAWLYLDDQAFVHLVGSTQKPQAGGNVTLEHFAFKAKDMPAFLTKLAAHDVVYSIDEVPGFPVVQVNFHDPDGNHIHVDFDSSEHAG